ncbi:putative peptidoglycan D,D-transpeptidase FtsI [bacterium HR39]|nr:putative peptidoglycan D,D-transpeptidase FtsI [bacterium HR39]
MTAPRDPLARSRRRLRLLALFFLLAYAAVGVRLGHLLLRDGGDPEGGDEARKPVEVPARADIVDRRGRLLATDIPMAGFALDPLFVHDPEATARLLAAELDGVDAADLARPLSRPGRRFAWVKRELLPEEQRRVLELGLPGTILRYGRRRVWPQGDLAGHLLGTTGVDHIGLAGVEYAYDSRLRDLPDVPLRLSLDLAVQQVLREELEAAFRRFRARGACGLVLDLRDGGVLALSSLPALDPLHYGESAPEVRLNRCTGAVYELGSMFKLVSVAAALESGRVSLYDRFDVSGPLRIGRHRISDVHRNDRPFTVPEIIAHSSNIGTAQMVFAAGGAPVLREMLHRLGFDAPPAWPLPERDAPLFPQRWPEVVVATVSFGHGIAVSPLQFATGVAALVGDGHLRRPRLLADEPVDATPHPVVSERTVRDLRWLMWLVVERGTGTKAASPVYLVGGKTGTADKPAVGRRGYDRTRTISSFVGVFPIEDPRYLVLTVLDEPHGDAGTFGFRYGGWTAAPVVGAVIERLGPLLGVPPSTEEARRALESRLLVERLVDPDTGRRETRLAAVRADR